MKKLIVFMLEAALVFGLTAKGESKFRAEDYNPTIAQREGLAFLRIIGSPLSLFTEGAQYFNENKEATGDGSPIYFIVGMCLQGPFVTCFEAAGGVLELVSFQQFKSFAYPWEVDENDAKMVATIRENREKERLRQEQEPESDFIGEMLGAAAGAAAGAAVESAVSGKHHRRTQPVYVNSGGGTPSRQSSGGNANPSQRAIHSYCHGTGTCQICHGKGTVAGGSKKCVCGGSGRCSGCNGTGYAR